MKKCPYCAEKIQNDAVICRYCGRDQPKPIQIENKQRPVPHGLSSPWQKGAKIAAVFTVIFVIGVFFNYQNAPAELAGELTMGTIVTFFGWWLIVSLVIILWRKIRGKGSDTPGPVSHLKKADEKDLGTHTPAPLRKKWLTPLLITLVAVVFITILLIAVLSSNGGNLYINAAPTATNIQAAPTATDIQATQSSLIALYKVSAPDRWWTNCIGEIYNFDLLLFKGTCIYGVVTDAIHEGIVSIFDFSPPNTQAFPLVIYSDTELRTKANIMTSNDAITASVVKGDCIIAYGYPMYEEIKNIQVRVFFALRMTNLVGLERVTTDPSIQTIIFSCK